MDSVKTENYNENEDDEWLYGGANDEPEQQNAQDLNENPNFADLNDKNKEGIDLNDEYKRLDSIEQNQNDELNTIEAATPTAASENGDDESTTVDNQVKEIGVAHIDDNPEKEDDEDDEDEDEDDDDDDDVKVKVVIGPVNKPFSTLTTQTSKTNQIQTTVKPPTQVKGVDLEAQGSINDVPTLDFDIQQIKDEDKPWRKPGADITDYFNYGFNEETWIAYCMKQKKLRSENAVSAKQATINQTAPLIGQIPTTNTMQQTNGTAILANPPGLIPNPNFIHKISQQNQMQRPILQAGPGLQQQQRKYGQIDVIGTTETTSRRPQFELEMNMQNPIAVVSGGSFPPPHAGMPDLSAPPPGWPSAQPPPLVQTGPPPSLVQGPPPGVQLRPPGTGPMQRMGHPQQGPMSFGQQNYPYMGPPPPMIHERPPGMNYGYMPQFVPRNPVPPASHQWEKPNVNQQEQYYQEPASPRSRSRTPTPKKSSHSRSKSPAVEKYSKDQDPSKYKHNRDYNRGGGGGGDYRRSPSPRRSYRSHRDYDSRRGSEYDNRRSGDHRDKSRSRDRSRDKDRSRSRSRDRSRSREDRYKRSRRKSEHSDDDYRSSKSHKRSKKSRKGRDSNDRDTHSKSITSDSISNDQQQQSSISNKSSNDNKND